MFNITKNYNGIECSYHKIGAISSNDQEITVYVWSYIDILSEENGDDFINESIFTFNINEIDTKNLISSLLSKIIL